MAMRKGHAARRHSGGKTDTRRVAGMEKTGISLCMIVRDEEEFLPGCLDSVKGVADEIVVVDTGSTDRTMQIAREYGARVYQYEWSDDFAAARNESLKHATCGWILVLDADERLGAGAGETLKAVARGGRPKAIYAARIVNSSAPGSETQHYFPRFFPNREGIRYEGLIHERPVSRSQEALSRSQLPYRLEGFTVIHHGYKQEVVHGRGKMRRNIELLQRILEAGDDPYYRYKLGSMLLSVGKLPEAVSEIERVLAALESMDGDTRRKTSVGRVDVLLLLAEAYEKQGRQDDASRAIDRALEILPRSKEARHEKAVRLFRQGKLEEARGMFLALASDRAGDRSDTSGEQLVFDMSLDTWKPLVMVARCSLRLGDIPGAAEALADAAGFVPRSDDYLDTVRQTLNEIDRGRTGGGEEGAARTKLLRDILDEEAARRLAKADLLLAEGETARALELYAGSARLSGGGNGAVLAKIARAQLRLGNTREAFSTYLQALRSLPGDLEAVRLLLELTEEFKTLNSDAEGFDGAATVS
ncbi:MAG: glycosyltransferase [Firmicutes bacterium]|nr:glycosyltransferase [Bacillota bacterium]MDH7496364.1 glycosyltransferase [Bacillota bacterium]